MVCKNPEKSTHSEARSNALSESVLQSRKLEAVGQLAGGVAHDLSNLMTALFGWLEIARGQLPPEHGSRGALDMVDRAARQAVGLTRSLLAFTHQSGGERRPIRLDEAVREGTQLLKRLLPSSIDLEVQTPREATWIEGDATQIQQVLMNLALNARDAMPDGGKLEVRVECLTSPAQRNGRVGPRQTWSTLMVSDTGRGIAQSIRNRIFEPFFTTKERGSGTGLGLSIVHAIAEDHGACIDVRSSAGSGTAVTVRFPVIPAPPSGASAHANRQFHGNRGGVLIVEDNALVRAMLTTAFVDAGFCVFEAEDGVTGRSTFADNVGQIDVAVVDIDLPRLNGIELLESMQASHPRTQTIAITGYPLSPEFAERLRAQGCRLLPKPFKVPVMMELVARLMKGAR